MIVLMHSPHPEAGNPGYVVVPIFFVTAAGVCLFFMVSGALLFPIQTTTFDFLKKRLGKIIGPTLFWSLFYLGVSWFFDENLQHDTIKAVLSIPFSRQGRGILWFMYTLSGLYLLSPFISSFLKQATKKEVGFYLFLWTVTLIYPWINGLVIIDESTTGILYYFTGYVGYFVLGYYMHTYKPKVNMIASLLLIIVPIAALAIYEVTGHERWQSSDRFWYLSIFVAMMCVGWFSLVQKKFKYAGSLSMDSQFSQSGVWNSSLLRILSDCSFGIYLVHIFVMRNILWHVDYIVYGFGGIGQILITWFLTLFLSFTITYTISFIPYSEYIIGFTNKKRR